MRGKAKWAVDSLIAQLNSISKNKYSVVSCGSGTYMIAWISEDDGAQHAVSRCLKAKEIVNVLDALVSYAEQEK